MSATEQLLHLKRLYLKNQGRELKELHVTQEDFRVLKQEVEGSVYYREFDTMEGTIIYGTDIKLIGSTVSYEDSLTVIGLSIEDDRMRCQEQLHQAYARIDNLLSKLEKKQSHLESLQSHLESLQDQVNRLRNRLKGLGVPLHTQREEGLDKYFS